jgi:hypothetical protein
LIRRRDSARAFPFVAARFVSQRIAFAERERFSFLPRSDRYQTAESGANAPCRLI